MVLLGFIDEPKTGKDNGTDDDPKNWTISRIGGQPAFPSEQISIALKPTLICSKCENRQSFVCQLYCPLQGHRYDRAIYLYACRNNSCWNSSSSWTAIRCQKFDETVDEQQEETPPIVPSSSSTDWCDDANAWNSDDDDSQHPVQTVQFKTETMLTAMKIDDEQETCRDSSTDDEEIEFDEKSKKSSKTVPVASADAFAEWKKQNLQPAVVDISVEKSFPFYYIEIDDEQMIIEDTKLQEKKKSKNQIEKCNTIDEDDDEIGQNSKEKYEKTPDIEHGDVIFYKFQQKIRHAPSQIVRYDWSGQPLIITKMTNNSLTSAQKCRHCQSSCHFEFQLMPALVNFLKIDQEIGLEFGTVFVYTCSNNCWNESEDFYRFENVFVQADPDQNLFD